MQPLTISIRRNNTQYVDVGLVLLPDLRIGSTIQWMTTRPFPPRWRWPLKSLVAVVSVIALATSLAIILFLASDTSPGVGWVRVASVDDARQRRIAFLPELDAYVIADPQHSPLTLIARSPQIGVRVVYCPSSTWFEDPTHGSKFDRLGRYALGPAPRGLDRMATIVLDGQVWINPDQITLGPPREEHAQSPPAGPFCVF